jgi:hypothetical protein
MDNDFIGEKETSKETHFSVSKLQTDRHYGRGLPYYKVGRKILYKRSEVREYIERHRIEPVNK